MNWRVTIGADGVDVWEIWHAHLADVKLDPAFRHPGGQRVRSPVGVDDGVSDGLMELDTRYIGRRTKIRVADNVEIGKAGKAEGFAVATPCCRFQIEDGIEVELWIAYDLGPRYKVPRNEVLYSPRLRRLFVPA
jgi:hypothetical protein